MIINEDTGEVPECPFCGSRLDEDEECDHVLAVIDRTFGECEGGSLYEYVWDFQKAISAAMFAWLNANATPNWGEYPALQFIWDDARSLWNQGSIQTEDDLPFGEFGFWSTVENLLDEAGAVSAPGPLADQGCMPGTSAVYSVLYAEKPKTALTVAKQLLRDYLGDSDRLASPSSRKPFQVS